MKTIRVFPRRTNATPDDENVRVACPPGLFDEADRVHVSVSFTWDIPIAERLAKLWEPVAPVYVGGPALGTRGGDFVPGVYLKHGHVITSRGCRNRCWFCEVWRRDGGEMRELAIADGWIVQDDNLLACSEAHVASVFSMLRRQNRPASFPGGLEAAMLQPWMARELADLNLAQVFFAYDTPSDRDPLFSAGATLQSAGIPKRSHALRAYVLCGWPTDTEADAVERMKDTWRAGFMPFAMPYMDKTGLVSRSWRRFGRAWQRPAITRRLLRGVVDY